MKLTAVVLILAGTAFSQNRHPVQASSAKWFMQESHDEIHGDSLSFLLPSAETPVRSLSDHVPYEIVYLGVRCSKDGGVKVAYIPFNIPLHIDDTYVLDSGKTNSSTSIRYREENEVKSRLSRIEDDGSTVFTTTAEWFKPFIGKAIEIEDIFGHLHVFHFPAVTVEPLEGGCENYVKEINDIGQNAICGILRDKYSDNMRELTIGADKEDGGKKYRIEFNNDLRKDASQNPKCGLSDIKPIPLDYP